MKNINEFNEETRLIIKQFVEDLFTILPNLKNKISKTEIEKIIVGNLEHNIEFNADLVKRISGQYNSKDKKISISKRISGDEQQVKLTVFHEITHALTRDLHIYLDNYLGENPYFMEVMTTLLEQKYNNIIVKKATKKVNGYIPDFGMELQVVFGDELLEQLITEPSTVFDIFQGYDSEYKQECFFFLVDQFQELKHLVEDVSKDSELRLLVRKIETFISSQIQLYLDNADISHTSQIINDLYKMQHYPDYDQFYSYVEQLQEKGLTIKEFENLSRLISVFEEDDVNKLLDCFDTLRTEDKNTEKEQKAIMQKVFGYIDDNQGMIPPNIFGFLDSEEIYSNIIFLLKENRKYLESLNGLYFRKCSDSSKKFADTLKDDEWSKLMHFFGNSDRTNAFYVLYNNDCIDSIFDEGGIQYKKINILNQILELENPSRIKEFKEYILNVINSKKVSEFYATSYFDSLDEEQEYWSYYFYYFIGEDFLTEVEVNISKNNEFVFYEKEIALGKLKKVKQEGQKLNFEDLISKISSSKK